MTHSTVFSLLRLLPLALALACKPAAEPIVGPVPDHPDPDRPRTASSSGAAELPRIDQYADLAAEPRHYFLLHDADRTLESVIGIGHASEECCALLSEAEGASLAIGAVDGEGYHGYSELRARNEANSKMWLAGLVDSFRLAAAPGAACEGQVYFHEVSKSALDARTRRIAADAQDGQAVAAIEGRPVLIWNDNIEGAPHILPVQRIRKDGELEQLRFELTLAELGMPSAQYDTPPELKAELRKVTRVHDGIRAFINTLDELRKIFRKGNDLVLMENMVTTRGDQARAHMAEIEGFNTCLDRVRGWVEAMDDVAHSMQIQQIFPSEARELKEMKQRNLRTLKTLARMRPTDEATNPVTICGEMPFADAALALKEMQALDPLYEMAADLKQIVSVLHSLTTTARSVNFSMVLDSGLRGVNLVHEDATMDLAFDAWMVKHQMELWRKLRSQARKQGVELGDGDDPAGVLHASNLLLRVELKGKRVEISPHFVISGPFYQVVDPTAKLVYYESAIAEHNLEP
jgi:hypothetical protein